MHKRRILAGFAAVLVLGANHAFAASFVVGTLDQKDFKTYDMYDCGANFARAEDFRPRPETTRSWILIDTHDKALIRIDGVPVRLDLVKATEPTLANGKFSSRLYNSSDKTVSVEVSYKVTKRFSGESDELSYVAGKLKVSFAGRIQIIAVKGEEGC